MTGMIVAIPTIIHKTAAFGLLSPPSPPSPSYHLAGCCCAVLGSPSSHKSCFRCTHGGCVISPSNYIAHEGRLYCKHHHVQLIKEKGNLSQLEGDHDKSSAKVGAAVVAES